jgi:hypothetical protein
VFAPLGVEISRGIPRAFPSSVGLHLSVLDLGTLVSYQLSDARLPIDDPATDGEADGNGGASAAVDASPDINFSHVFAPGAYLVLGVTRTKPITIGFGAQYAPRLRGVEDDGTLDIGALDAVRWGGFVAVDLTFFRF